MRPTRVLRAWATVDLDRTIRDVATPREATGNPTPAPPSGGVSLTVETLPDDAALGARARSVTFADGTAVVVLEPATEGPLAAALAKHGEDWVASYLLADAGAPRRLRRAGIPLTPEAGGPLGPQRLLAGSGRTGPFVLVVRAD
ncbi:MAG: hypothetical protein HY263_05420 [Chloroflexi bacterium]|nr:hypothetical protein [Chloroflexota bacterium]